MNTLIPYDINDNPIDCLYQWDVSQEIIFKNVTLMYGSDSVPWIHFSSTTCGTAYVVSPTVESSGQNSTKNITALVPAALLEGTAPISVYLYEKNNVTGGGYRTTAKTKIVVVPRAKPANYDTLVE